MTDRIAIMRRTSGVVDGRKQTVESEFYACWCEVQDLNSTEKYSALQTKLEETIVFKVRECKRIKEMRKHLKEFYVLYQGDEFEIYAATPMFTDNRKILLKANRIS